MHTYLWSEVVFHAQILKGSSQTAKPGVRSRERLRRPSCWKSPVLTEKPNFQVKADTPMAVDCSRACLQKASVIQAWVSYKGKKFIKWNASCHRDSLPGEVTDWPRGQWEEEPDRYILYLPISLNAGILMYDHAIKHMLHKPTAVTRETERVWRVFINFCLFSLLWH